MRGAGSRASLTGVAVEDSGGSGISTWDGGAVALYGGSVSGCGDGDCDEGYGGRIERH